MPISNRSFRRSSKLVNIATVALMVLGSAACGHKGPPKPPASRIPSPAQDLEVQQRGTDVILQMSYPSVTLGGAPLGEIESIDVWEASLEIPEYLLDITTGEDDTDSSSDAEAAEQAGEQAPVVAEQAPEEEAVGFLFQVPTELDDETPLEARIPLDPKTFGSSAKRRLELSGAEIDAAVSGDKLVFRLAMNQNVAPATEFLAFAVQIKSDYKKVSAFSNLAKLVPKEAPTPPTSLEVIATPTGIEIHWESETAPRGFRVYRKDAQSRDFGAPLALKPADQSEHFDESASYGNRYVYAVTTVGSRNPLIESAIAAQQEVHYRDKFAPGPPINLVAFASDGRVRLLWDEPLDGADVVGYRVFRATLDGKFERISEERVQSQEYLDTDVVSGQTYRYKVRAADKARNRSDFSAETEVRVP